MIKRWCINSLGIQAWWGRKRQVHGYHPPYSIQDEWLATDDQKNNILGSLSSYLAENWLQKLEIKHCAYYTEVISVCLCVCVCVCVCMCGISVQFIYNKTKLPSCKMSVFVPYTWHFFAIFKSAIMEVELDDRGKYNKTTDGGNWKHNIKSNLVELNKVQK